VWCIHFGTLEDIDDLARRVATPTDRDSLAVVQARVRGDAGVQVDRRLLGDGQGFTGARGPGRRAPLTGGMTVGRDGLERTVLVLEKCIEKSVGDVMTGPDVWPTTPDAAMWSRRARTVGRAVPFERKQRPLAPAPG